MTIYKRFELKKLDMNNINFNKPAVVRYNAKSNRKFTKGKLYKPTLSNIAKVNVLAYM